MNAVAIIPARYHSTRFPGKPLVKISGVSMIERVVRAARDARLVSDVIVATDSDLILKECDRIGARWEMTPSTCRTGTERVAVVAKRIDAEIFVNVQGDEPLIRGASIDALVEEIRRGAEIATIATRRSDRSSFKDPDRVKVVTDVAGDALYFSRAGIPHGGDASFLLHVGIYAFRKDALCELVLAPRARLETTEDLEQLRWIERGKKIRVILARYPLVSVDTPGDVARASLFLRASGS